ncbi:MAG: hypothetical protein M1820_008126 [Bogoriella megaspora]|nr:MAG: hypothetical protein M1820_008126 [Bogoriella megaspora]
MDLSFSDVKIHDFLYIVGSVSVVLLLLKISSFLWLYAKPSSLSRYKHKDTKSWALVTGATDGIGRALALELTKRGFSVLLHGRNPSKLSRVKSEIEASVPDANLQTTILNASTFTTADITTLAQTVSNLDGKLTVLINNVGGVNYTPVFGPFTSLAPSDIDATLNMNARFPTQLTHALLPLLSSNSPSLVINIGSMAGVAGTPYVTTYAACKAFNHTFSTSLTSESRLNTPAGVEVLGLLVGTVRTTKHQVELNVFAPTAEVLARAALARVGCGERLVNAYFWHAVQAGFLGLVSDWIGEAMVRGIMVKKVEEEKGWKVEAVDGRPEEKAE